MSPDNNLDPLQQQYATTEAWQIRIETHQKYSFPKIDFPTWTMNLVQLRGDESILDVGCGPGQYYSFLREHYPNVTYTGLDYSFAMIADHPGSDTLVRGKMDHLPFADDSFDVVMANHVLYFAPDVEQAIVEMQRVLKPGGVFVAATSSIQTMPQFRELFRRAILLVSPPGVSRDVSVPEGLHRRFSLENGSRMLSKHYYAVVRHDLPGAFVFSQVDPILDYLESTRSVREQQLPDNVSWDQVMLIMREQITNLIASLQTLVVDKLTGVLIATDSGGFIEGYLEARERHEQKAKTADKTS